MKLLAGIDWRGRAWIIYLAVGGLLTAAYRWYPPLKGSGPLINLLGLSSSVAIAVGMYLHRPKARAAWLLIILGQFLFFAGDLYTYSYPKLFGADVEFPSLGDAIYLTVYPLVRAALLVRRRTARPRRDRLLILTVGIALLSWVFLVAPNIRLSGLAAREGCIRRLSARGHPAARRSDPPRGRQGKARSRLLPPGQQHRRAARRGLRLHLRAPHGRVQPSAEL